MVDKNREKMKRVLKRIHKKNQVNQISSRLFNQKGSRVFPLDGSKIVLLPCVPILGDVFERNEFYVVHRDHRMGRKGKVALKRRLVDKCVVV